VDLGFSLLGGHLILSILVLVDIVEGLHGTAGENVGRELRPVIPSDFGDILHLFRTMLHVLLVAREIALDAGGIESNVLHVLRALLVFDFDAVVGGVASAVFGLEGVGANGSSEVVAAVPDGTEEVIGVEESVRFHPVGPGDIDLAGSDG